MGIGRSANSEGRLLVSLSQARLVSSLDSASRSRPSPTGLLGSLSLVSQQVPTNCLRQLVGPDQTYVPESTSVEGNLL